MPPMNFEKVFIEHGWRGVENYFMPRSNVLKRWLHFIGEETLVAKRKAFMAGESVGA